MKRTILVIFCVLCAVSAAVWRVGHNGNSFLNSDKSMIGSTSIIRLGDPTLSNLDGAGKSVDRHPVGLNFYQKEFSTNNPGKAEFIHGQYSFSVDHVLSLIGTEDREVPGGIFEWSINFGLSDNQVDAPDVARDGLTRFFAKLRAAGWKRNIDVDQPRLNGQQAWYYGTTGDVAGIYSLDSTYVPTLKEWQATDAGIATWIFYADGVYLKIFIQSSNMAGVPGKRTYLVTENIMNEYDFYGVGFFPGEKEKMLNWKALLPAELERYHAIRLKTEAALKEQGYRIDTTYQDPPILALQASPGGQQ